MSRGHGHIQRDLLAVLESENRPFDAFLLAAEVYDVEPGDDGLALVSDAMLVSVRRALVKLAAEGKIIKVVRFRAGPLNTNRTWWANERFGVWMKCRWLKDDIKILGWLHDEHDEAKMRELYQLMVRARELGVDIDKEEFSLIDPLDDRRAVGSISTPPHALFPSRRCWTAGELIAHRRASLAGLHERCT